MLMRWLCLGLAIATLGGCERLRCGPGTVLTEKQCLPIVECGPGTMEIEGECVPDDQIECGEGTVRRGDECVAVSAYWVHLPFAEGAEVRVSQGNHGSFSHKGSSVHALDFPLAEGTPIHAVAAGRVARVRSDSNSGCGEPECSSDANYIILDHGDGILSRYWHLEYGGVDVAVGDVVERGQQIGRSGNTGFSTGPHLHLAITDLMRQSLPVRFEDLRATSDGAAFAGVPLISTNAQVPNETTPSFSDCPADMFSWMGVKLDPGFPCVVAEVDTTYLLSGEQYGQADRLAYAQWYGEWNYACEPTEPNGRFSIPVEWSSDIYGGLTYVMVGAGEEDCSFGQGWGASPSITLIDP